MYKVRFSIKAVVAFMKAVYYDAPSVLWSAVLLVKKFGFTFILEIEMADYQELQSKTKTAQQQETEKQKREECKR